MSKLIELPRLPILTGDAKEDMRRFVQVSTERFRDIHKQVNSVSSGKLAGTFNADSAMPVAGYFAQGDFVKNSEPAEEGTVSAKYVVAGWLAVADGSASASASIFVPCRFLTGN